jgi:uncharacterized membrane protein YhfC
LAVDLRAVVHLPVPVGLCAAVDLRAVVRLPVSVELRAAADLPAALPQRLAVALPVVSVAPVVPVHLAAQAAVVPLVVAEPQVAHRPLAPLAAATIGP